MAANTSTLIGDLWQALQVRNRPTSSFIMHYNQASCVSAYRSWAF